MRYEFETDELRFEKAFPNARALEFKFIQADQDNFTGKYKCILKEPIHLPDYIQNIHSKIFSESKDADLKRIKEEIEDFVWVGYGKLNTPPDSPEPNRYDDFVCWTRDGINGFEEKDRCGHRCMMSIR